MQKSKIKVGRYYLVNLSMEMNSFHGNGTPAGKLLEVTDTEFVHNSREQIYFIEFLESHHNLHGGLNMSKKVGKDSHCYYVSSKSIIKEVTLAEVLAKEL